MLYRNEHDHLFLFRENLFAFIGFQIKIQRITETEETRERGLIHPNLGNSKKLEIIESWKAVTVTKRIKKISVHKQMQIIEAGQAPPLEF